MKKLGLSALVFEFTVFASAILSLHVKFTDSWQTRRLDVAFAPDLQEFKQFENKIAINLTLTLTHLSLKLLPIGSEMRHMVHSYLTDFYQSSGFSQIPDVLGSEQIGMTKNPICAYRMIRRTLRLLKNLITHQQFLLKFGALRREVIHFFWRNGWPIFKNNILAAEKILKLQNVYDLEAEKLAMGSILEFHTNCSLSSTHSYEIGYIAYKTDQFTLALEWLELAREKTVVDKMASVAFIELLIWRATDDHNLEFVDKNNKALGLTMFNRKIRYIPGDSKRAQKVRDINYEKFKGNRGSAYKQINIRRLCSGENLQTEQEKSYLFCWLEYKLHPSLIIGPLKMEFLARNPDVVQAYEITQDKRIKANLSDPRTSIARCGVGKLQTGLKNSGLEITATDSWFDRDDILLQKIKKLSEAADISSEVQVESFSFLARYFSRNCQVNQNSSNLEDGRIKMFIVQLNDVEKGGLAAFPSLGVAAKPVKGSVVFWHGLYQNGRVDASTNYKPCPVLIGQKLVATYWIRYKDQLFQQCGLNRDERFRFPVNNEYLPTPIMETINTEEHPPPPKYPFGVPVYLTKYSYLSPLALKSLVQLEWNIYPRIKHLYNKYRNKTNGTFREAFERQNKYVKAYLEEFEKFTVTLIGSLEGIKSADIKTVEKVALNVLASFRMVTRFMDYIQPWVQRKSWEGNKLMTSIASYLGKVYNITDGPTQIDFESAMFGLYNIQFIHNLDIKDITIGIVAAINTKVTLNARDCLNIAKYSAVFSDYTRALIWAEHALHLTKNESDDSVKYEEVYDYYSTFQMDFDCTVRPQNPICHVKTENDHMERVAPTLREVTFSTMCKGKTFQTNKGKLFCWYERETHPSYKIGPIKAEWLSMRPKAEVVIFHDIISDRLMNSLANFSYNETKRFATSDDGKLFLPSLHHQLIYGSAYQKTHKAAIYTAKLIERITGLNVVNKTNGPPLRVLRYAPGSFRAVHHDQSLHVGSFLFYFNEVQAGGETALIYSGINIVPRKGSAVFWYNLFTDGNVDNSTYHGGCPVIMGEKWASLQRIMYFWQDHLKCDLKPNTPFEIFVNGKSKYNKLQSHTV